MFTVLTENPCFFCDIRFVRPYFSIKSTNGIFPVFVEKRYFLEAGLMKKPVIATDVGGISESIKPNTGFLIQENDYEEWIKKISFLLDNKQEISNMGNEGHEYIKDEFSWEKISDDFLNIIENETKIIKR